MEFFLKDFPQRNIHFQVKVSSSIRMAHFMLEKLRKGRLMGTERKYGHNYRF